MLSGMLRTSCMTTPLSSRRFCSLFKSWAYTTPATRVRHAAATRYFFIADLQGHTAFLDVCFDTDFRLKNFQRVYVRRGLCVTRFSAGYFRKLALVGLISSEGAGSRVRRLGAEKTKGVREAQE